jgi:hypothetical protein
VVDQKLTRTPSLGAGSGLAVRLVVRVRVALGRPDGRVSELRLHEQDALAACYRERGCGMAKVVQADVR